MTKGYKLVVIESPYAANADEVEKLVDSYNLPDTGNEKGIEKLRENFRTQAREELVDRNLRYLRACMKDCLRKGESPYASHALYTQPGVLDDDVPEEREWGIQAGFAWRKASEMTVVYTDFGTSTGMEYGIKHAIENGRDIEYRTLGADWDETEG